MSRAAPLCVFCKRRRDYIKRDSINARTHYYCDAYPDGDGIPEALYWETTHFKPKAGDNGLQFIPKDDADAEYIEYLRKNSADEDEDFKYFDEYYKELDMTDEEWIKAREKEGWPYEMAKNLISTRNRRETEPDT